MVITLVKSLFLPSQRTLDLEYQDGGDELQNLITEITAMRDLGLFISVVLLDIKPVHVTLYHIREINAKQFKH